MCHQVLSFFYGVIQIDIILNYTIFGKVAKDVHEFDFFSNIGKYVRNPVKILTLLKFGKVYHGYNMNNPYNLPLPSVIVPLVLSKRHNYP